MAGLQLLFSNEKLALVLIKGIFTVSGAFSVSVNASKWAPHPFPASASTFCVGISYANADAHSHCE